MAVTINRWRIPVGAVLVHICIGSVYAWSTFNRPIQQLFPDQPWWFSPPYTTFTTALALLGLSAAFGGPWVERRGPRAAATAAAVFVGSGLLIGGAGLMLQQPWLVFLGMGVVGGIGCGLGYISPVSTLVKWFPDRRGMATRMAIMGLAAAPSWPSVRPDAAGAAAADALARCVSRGLKPIVCRRPEPSRRPSTPTPTPSQPGSGASRA